MDFFFLEFVDVLVSVHGRRVFVFSFTLRDQDKEEQEDEQTTNGDTHSNQTGLVWGEFVIVFGSGSVDADDDAVGVGVDRSSVSGDLEDDVIFDSLYEVELAALPDADWEAEGSLNLSGDDRLEVLDVGLLESGRRSTPSGVGGLETRARDGLVGDVRGDDGDLIGQEAGSSAGRSARRSTRGSRPGAGERLGEHARGSGRPPGGRRRERLDAVEAVPVGSQLSRVGLAIDVDQRGRAVEGVAAGGKSSSRGSRRTPTGSRRRGDRHREEIQGEKDR